MKDSNEKNIYVADMNKGMSNFIRHLMKYSTPLEYKDLKRRIKN